MNRKNREIVIEGDVAIVELTKGMWAGIDAEDVPLIENHSWAATWNGSAYYATCGIRSPARETIYMHRFLMGEKNPKVHIDHRNRETLDNRRSNLRRATPTQNHANSRLRGGSSRFKGVYWDKSKKKWSASITMNGKRKQLGRFNSEEEAASVYDKAAELYFGEFSLTNSQLAA